MQVLGTREKGQPAPPHVVFEALADPRRPSGRQWLDLWSDEEPPRVLEAVAPGLVVWSSLWPRCPDARVRFDLEPVRHETSLRWTLLADVDPEPSLVGHLSKRLDRLVNADLRYSFGG